METIERIRAAVPKPALYELLAEECTELAHAALKVARIVRKENPSPANLFAAVFQTTEEYSDVHLVAEVLDIKPNTVIMEEKLKRWIGRIEKAGDTE